jgi:molybdate transport system ATP-binding protein
MLEVAVRRRQGEFTLDVAFTTDRGVTALFGRSGAGKTTVLNIIAGLVRPAEGRIAIDDRVLFDRAAGIDLPPHRRRIGYVFQDARLFPHLSVRRNLLFGAWFARDVEPLAPLNEITGLLGLDHLLARAPRHLSGGERQRVAIGRALLAAPRALVLDEPLASLDAARRDEILPYIARLRDELRIPVVYVSHILAEVVRLADQMVVLSDGRVVATGAVGEVMARIDLFPMTGRYEAGAVLDAVVEGQPSADGLSRLSTPAGDLLLPALDLPPRSGLRVRVRARDVVIAVQPPVGLSTLNALPGRVEAIAADGGPIAEIRLLCGQAPLVARVTRRSVDQLGLVPGRHVWALIKSVSFDRRTSGAAATEPERVELDL